MDFTQTVITRNAESCLFWGRLEFSYRHPAMDSGINRAGGCLFGRVTRKVEGSSRRFDPNKLWKFRDRPCKHGLRRRSSRHLPCIVAQVYGCGTATMALATDWGDSGRTAHRLFLLDKRALRLQNSRANLLFQLKS
jgi:hypothetical protein